ncbi:MAG: beta-lactamase family protein [Cyclobacteriaceae bacterium]|nr:beta-lactamase family protein [Cyclobacteriaceae bacterium]
MNKYRLRILVISIFSLLVSFRASSQYFPEKGSWEKKNATSVKVNQKNLEKAVEFAKSNEYSGSKDLRIATLESFASEPYHEIAGPVKHRGGPAGLIIKDGYIIADWGDVERVDMTFSVTKSYLSTVAALAWQDKKIRNVNDKVGDYVWDGTFEGSHNSKITWEHLFQQNSDWSGELFGMQDWADRPERGGNVNTWSHRELKEPGTFFKYNDVRVNVLAYSLLQVIRQPLPSFLKERVMDKIGASDTWRWFGYESSWVTVDGYKMQSVSGGGHSGGGIFINTMDHARFGLLFLRNGKWNNEQIVSTEWIKMMRNPSKTNDSYGYLWWLNQGARKWEGVGETVYYAAGFGGNFIIIDEKNDLLVVTRWLEPSKVGEFMKLVTQAM